MQLSNRMLAIAGMVSPGYSVADVGCDHGYLPIWLVSQKISPRAIAMDIGDGPLERARDNITQQGLLEYIETRKSDGTAALLPGECESLIIAGMGGPLMERILMARWEVTRSFKEIILEPQSDVGHMRMFLADHGYCITHENMIYEDGKFYPVMRVVEGEMMPLSDVEMLYGPLLLQEKNQVLLQFLMREKRLKTQLLDKLQLAKSSEKAKHRIQVLRQELDVLNEGIGRF